jgi:hypothetical protein
VKNNTALFFAMNDVLEDVTLAGLCLLWKMLSEEELDRLRENADMPLTWWVDGLSGFLGETDQVKKASQHLVPYVLPSATAVNVSAIQDQLVVNRVRESRSDFINMERFLTTEKLIAWCIMVDTEKADIFARALRKIDSCRQMHPTHERSIIQLPTYRRDRPECMHNSVGVSDPMFCFLCPPSYEI